MSKKNSANKEHSYYMKIAMKAAKRALAKNEVPIGAVVVDPEGNIVATASNMVHRSKSQTEHAEVRAIKKACKKLGDWRLDGYWVYVTLEPCTMCYGLMRLCRISGLVYGAKSALFGYRLDKGIDLDVYKKDTIEVIAGVLRDEAVDILRSFFKNKRKKGERRKKQYSKFVERHKKDKEGSG
ncbi:nucleoside deaminase [Candidatus Dependentiae bacterium]